MGSLWHLTANRGRSRTFQLPCQLDRGSLGLSETCRRAPPRWNLHPTASLSCFELARGFKSPKQSKPPTKRNLNSEDDRKLRHDSRSLGSRSAFRVLRLLSSVRACHDKPWASYAHRQRISLEGSRAFRVHSASNQTMHCVACASETPKLRPMFPWKLQSVGTKAMCKATQHCNIALLYTVMASSYLKSVTAQAPI